jgi:hypothetical protein
MAKIDDPFEAFLHHCVRHKITLLCEEAISIFVRKAREFSGRIWTESRFTVAQNQCAPSKDNIARS